MNDASALIRTCCECRHWSCTETTSGWGMCRLTAVHGGQPVFEGSKAVVAAPGGGVLRTRSEFSCGQSQPLQGLPLTTGLVFSWVKPPVETSDAHTTIPAAVGSAAGEVQLPTVRELREENFRLKVAELEGLGCRT